MCAARTTDDGNTFSTCQGDSGGPVISEVTKKQVGVVSVSENTFFLVYLIEYTKTLVSGGRLPKKISL